jgi:hypothetical protein
MNYKCVMIGKKALKICFRFCNVHMVKITSSFPLSVVKFDISVGCCQFCDFAHDKTVYTVLCLPSYTGCARLFCDKALLVRYFLLYISIKGADLFSNTCVCYEVAGDI